MRDRVDTSGRGDGHERQGRLAAPAHTRRTRARQAGPRAPCSSTTNGLNRSPRRKRWMGGGKHASASAQLRCGEAREGCLRREFWLRVRRRSSTPARYFMLPLRGCTQHPNLDISSWGITRQSGNQRHRIGWLRVRFLLRLISMWCLTHLHMVS